MSAAKRRSELRAAAADLSTDDRVALNQYLIGAFSASVSASQWGDAVAVAFECLHAEQARRAERGAA